MKDPRLFIVAVLLAWSSTADAVSVPTSYLADGIVRECECTEEHGVEEEQPGFDPRLHRQPGASESARGTRRHGHWSFAARAASESSIRKPSSSSTDGSRRTMR